MIVTTCPGTEAGGAVAAPMLGTSDHLATAGYFRLTWSPANPDAPTREYQLQRANDPRFMEPVTIYEGPDRASVVSGLADQVYFFRVREQHSPAWSAPVRVEVKHHPLARAFGFFSLGAIVFAVMLGVLLTGVRGEAWP